MMRIGGMQMCVVDDLSPVRSGSEAHVHNVGDLIHHFDNGESFPVTKLSWSTGLMNATRLNRPLVL